MAGKTGQLLEGRYRLIEPVGQGGMGRVWRGFDETLNRTVAVKEILLPEGQPAAGRDYTIARTVREARAAARLHHPGIVRVYDSVDRDGVPWIIMEFIAGPSLAQLISRDGRLEWPRVAAIGADLAAALAHAHAAGVVHRDLKPGNVLLAGDRTVLTDFGIARMLDVSTKLTSTGTILGTPHYMPPEQIEGEFIRAPVDVWALGATLYHAVEGSPPYNGPTLTAVLSAVLTRPVPEPAYAGPMTPLLRSMLSKASHQRPNAAALAEQLAALARPGPLARISGSLRAAPRGAAAPDAPAGRPRPPSPVRSAVLSGHSGRVCSVAFSPDGATLASGCDQGVAPDGSLASGGRRVRLWNVATRTCTATLAGPEGASSSVTFSPDGTILASGNSGDPVHLWRLGRRFRRSATMLPGDTDVLSVAFSPDGATLAAASSFKTVRLWDVAARTCAATLTGHNGGVYAVAFSPDGRRLATGSGDYTVRLWDAASQSCLAILTGHSAIVRGVAFRPDGALLASASADATIRLWDVRARSLVGTLGGDTGAVYCLAFSPGGGTLASGGAHNTVRLWDMGTGRCAATLTGHAEPVTSVAFSPDGRTLASSSHDKTVRLWDLR